MNYQRHYGLLIERARARNKTEDYTERHHVVPRCLGGSDEAENLVRLTPEEHYVAHQLLVKINPGNVKLLYAVAYMCAPRGPGLTKNKMYGWLRRKLSIVQSEKFSGRTWSPEQNASRSEAVKRQWENPEIRSKMISNMSKPRIWTDETKTAHSLRTTEMLKKLWKDPSYRENRIAKMRGRKMTEEQKAAVSKRMTGRKMSEESKKKALETKRLNQLAAAKEQLHDC